MLEDKGDNKWVVTVRAPSGNACHSVTHRVQWCYKENKMPELQTDMSLRSTDSNTYGPFGGEEHVCITVILLS